MTSHLDPQQARDLLDQAGRLGSAARSGASWPQIACLLGIGGVSAMFAVALYFVGHTDGRLVALPLVVAGVWFAILITVMVRFARATKAGFGKRWGQAMAAWTVAWVFTVVGSTVWWVGELWFAIASAALLTLVTTLGAWREARQ